MKIRPVTKLIVAFRNFAKAPKMHTHTHIYIYIYIYIHILHTRARILSCGMKARSDEVLKNIVGR